jgi:hypothetical protein
MIATSTLAMFPLMYHLVYSLDQATFSLNRGGRRHHGWSMYAGAGVKAAVLAEAAVVAGSLLLLNRSQQLVDDVAFMRAMILHHSIAINNARKANISDPRVRRLADQIIASQVRGIREMELLIAEIERNGERGDRGLPAAPAEVTREMIPAIREAVRQWAAQPGLDERLVRHVSAAGVVQCGERDGRSAGHERPQPGVEHARTTPFLPKGAAAARPCGRREPAERLRASRVAAVSGPPAM